MFMKVDTSIHNVQKSLKEKVIITMAQVDARRHDFATDLSRAN